MADKEGVEDLAAQVHAGPVEEVSKEPLVHVLVLEILHRAPQLGVSISNLGVYGRGVQAETGIATEICELGGSGHSHQHHLAFEDQWFQRADPRVPIRSNRGEHAQVVCRNMTAEEDLSDARRLVSEL